MGEILLLRTPFHYYVLSVFFQHFVTFQYIIFCLFRSVIHKHNTYFVFNSRLLPAYRQAGTIELLRNVVETNSAVRNTSLLLVFTSRFVVSPLPRYVETTFLGSSSVFHFSLTSSNFILFINHSVHIFFLLMTGHLPLLYNLKISLPTN